MTAPGTQLYSTRQAAERWGKRLRTVQKWVDRRYVHVVKIGTRNYVPAAEIARIEACQPSNAA